MMLYLTACPIASVRRAENQLKYKDTIMNPKAEYLKKPYSYQSFKEVNKESEKLINSSSPKMNISSVNSFYYPDSIIVDVIITDDDARYYLDLAPPFLDGDYKNLWYELHDNCENNGSKISNYSVREYRSKDSPKYAFAFVLDYSGSMGAFKLRNLNDAIQNLVKYMKEPDMVTGFKFGAEIQKIISLERNKFDVLDSFEIHKEKSINPVGDEFFKCSKLAVEELAKAPDDYERILITISDGGHFTDFLSENDIVKLAKNSNVKVFSLGFADNNWDIDDSKLVNMSEPTGGRYYKVYSTREFPYVFRDLYMRLSNFYRIVFKPNECDGQHDVEVKLNLDLAGNVNISGKGQYYIPKFKEDYKAGEIVLFNIEYEIGDYHITDINSLQMIYEISQWMKDHPENNILVKGHTDSQGGKDFNLKLSKKRANEVKNLLVQSGIEANRIETEGYGDTKPLFPNDSPENMRKNRRTEIEIIR